MGKLGKIYKAESEQMVTNVCNSIVKELGVASLDTNVFNRARSEHFKIKLDGYGITEISLDRHNNFYCRFNAFFPVEYLNKFAAIIEEFIENKDSYVGRCKVGLFIRYFEKYCADLTKEDVLYMMENGTTKDGSFKEWLIGNSCTTGGNLRFYDDLKFNITDFIHET